MKLSSFLFTLTTMSTLQFVRTLLLTFTLLLFAACASTNDTPAAPTATIAPVVTAEMASEAGYPVETSVTTDNGYPVADAAGGQPDTLTAYQSPVAEAPTDGTGKIVGRLVDPSINAPHASARIILGTVRATDDGTDTVITMRELSSPQTRTDAQGYFQLDELMPGEYVLILWTPLGTKMLEDPINGSELYIDLMANQVAEVGQLEFAITQ